MREYRAENPLAGEARAKANARAYAHVYLKRGKLQRQPCQDCGAERVQMHHADHARPLDVTWLCRPCRLSRHGRHGGARVRR